MKIIPCIIFYVIKLNAAYCQDTIGTIAYFFPQPESYFEDRNSSNFFYLQSQLNNVWQIGIPAKTIFNSSSSFTLSLITDTLNPYPPENRCVLKFVVQSDDYTFIEFFSRYKPDF